MDQREFQLYSSLDFLNLPLRIYNGYEIFLAHFFLFYFIQLLVLFSHTKSTDSTEFKLFFIFYLKTTMCDYVYLKNKKRGRFFYFILFAHFLSFASQWSFLYPFPLLLVNNIQTFDIEIPDSLYPFLRELPYRTVLSKLKNILTRMCMY